MEATAEIRPTTVGAELQVDLQNIKDADALAVRTAMDAVSMTLLGKDLVGQTTSPLRIDQLNAFVVEGFNWFGAVGISNFLTKRHMEFIHGVLIPTNVELHRPRSDQVSGANTSVPLWPNYARLHGLDYSGELIVTAEVHWNEDSGRTGVSTLSIRFGKIPIALGSQFCNLATLQTFEQLVDVGEDCNDYMGYFVIKGNERNLISQNYLKPNNDIVIASKMGSSQLGRRTCCNNRSMGQDGTTHLLRVYIASNHSEKITHSDRRIYCQMPWTKVNVYDKGGASSTGISSIGINMISIFRLTVILLKLMDPIEQKSNYDLEKGYRYAGPNADFQSTLTEAGGKFGQYIREYGGEKLFALSENYISDTWNEAFLEKDEQRFWESCYKCSRLNLDKPAEAIAESGKKGGATRAPKPKLKPTAEGEADEEDLPDVPLSEKVADILKLFGEQFFPHLASRPFAIQRRELLELKNSLRKEIGEAHKKAGMQVANEQSEQEIDTTLNLARALNYFTIMAGNLPAGDPNRPSEDLLNQYKGALAARGITLGPGWTKYNNAVLKMEELRKDMDARMALLAYMAVKVLRVEMNIDTYDDRDNLSNQLYDHPGMLMLSRFTSMVNDIAKAFREKKDDLKDEKTIIAFLSKEAEENITKMFTKNFADGNWNSKSAKKTRTGVTDIMPASVTPARLSYLRRVSSGQGGGHSKNTAARELTGLQLGLVCPSETPEGKQCGNVEHLATAAYITNDSDENNTLAHRFTQLRSSRGKIKPEDVSSIISHKRITDYLEKLKVEKNYPVPHTISSTRTATHNCPLFLNGRPMGWVDGLVFRRHLIEQRREGFFHPHTGIHFAQKQSRAGLLNYLKVETTGGRIVQPLIIAEDPQKTVNFLWRLITSDATQRIASFADLVANGAIEYVDAAELEFLDLAPSVTDYLKSIQEGLPQRYDHIMINPAFLMGVAGNLMPFAQMNPVVRNSYFTQMVKQPVDVPLPTYQERAYTGVAALHTPQVPIVKTDMYDKVFTNDYFGMNVRLLVTTHMNNEEDGIVVREGFLKNGGLSSTKYSMFTMDVESNYELNFNEGFMEVQEGPERYARGVIRSTKEVIKTDPVTGNPIVVQEPVIVRPNELLARKMTNQGNVAIMKDLKYESLRDGIVDKVMWVKGEATKKLYVSIKFPDNLGVGDKVAARYSQKGVIAGIIKDEDMPYDAETGERADIIMNPQAFPSRMTVGMMAEILVANAHVYPDKNKTYGTLFRTHGFDLFCPLERLFVVDEAAWKRFRTPDNQFPNPIGEMLVQEQETRPSTPSKPTIVTSEEAVGQAELNWLMTNDLIKNTIPEYGNGMWVLKFFGDRQGKMTGVESKKRSGQRVSIQEAREFAPRGPKYIRVQLNQTTDAAEAALGQLMTGTSQVDRFFMGIPMQAGLVKPIPGIYFDGVKDEQTGVNQNVQLGIRLTELSTAPLDAATNPFAHMGNTLQEIYLQGNWLTPVPTQYVAGYLPHFFNRQNLEDLYYDYGIPENARLLSNIMIPGNNVPQDMTLDPKATLAALKLEKTKIKALFATPAGQVEWKETTLFELWNSRYPGTLLVPRENVVNLPSEAKDIYTRRKAKITSLRNATIFKEGMDTNDAMRELKMMGYDEKMKSTFIDPRTGKEIAHKITVGWSYYMPLKHKVKNKIQGRGLGKKDHLTRQPIAGRNFEGGMRFNYGDALAVYKSGAANFVADRLLNSSKTDVYVCTDCRDICYQQNGNANSRPIICPNCKETSRAVKISVPYVFLLQRNMLAAAGVKWEVVAEADDDLAN